MDYITTTLGNLIHQTAFFNLTVGNFIMILVAFAFLYLAIRKGYEPLLLVPISFGMLLVNLFPDIMMTLEEAAATGSSSAGLLHYFYLGDEWGIWPSLIFLGVGAMTDFGPLIANPKSFLLGAQPSLVYLLLISALFFSDFRMRQQRRSPLSAARTDRHLFILPEHSGRPIF